MEELLTLIIQNIKNFEESMKFRKGQKPFYDKIIEGLKKDWTTMFIKGPTGMGKTFLQAVLAAAIIGDSNIKILLLTSKITLLKQIQGEFVKFVGFLSTGLFGGGFKDHHQQVTIMTYASYQRQKESFVKQFKVLLLDEGHRGLGKLTKVQLEKQKEFSILIGFTASDEYSKEKSLTQFLVNKAHELSIGEAVELGMLSNIKVMFASVDIEISGQAENETKGDYENRISSDIIRQGGNIATARLYKRVFAKRNLRGICLVLTTNQGNDLVEQFALEGVKAELIHSGLKRTEREDMFTRFRNNEFTVLIGMSIIKEGFNDPAVSVAITTYPVGSRVDMTQFPGRAERIDDDNPDKVAYVVNLAYKSKKQLFYTDILDGKSEVLQKRKRTRKLDIISSSEMRSAIIGNPESFITSIAVSEEEVKSLIRSSRGFFSKALEIAPFGWKTATAISNKGGQQKLILKFVERYRIDSPDWFGIYFAENGNSYEYYDPELVSVIENEFKKRNWIVLQTLARKCGTSRKRLKKFLNPFRESNPDWFHFDLVSEYFHPEIEKKAELYFLNINSKLQWLHAGDLAKELPHSTWNKIRVFADSFVESNSDWFFRDGKTLRYSHELCEQIRFKFVKSNLPKKGWITKPVILRTYSISPNIFVRLFNIFVKKNKKIKITEKFLSPNGNSIDHYNPLFFNKIKDFFNLPSGWLDVSSLSNKLGIRVTVRNIKSFVLSLGENEAQFKGLYIINTTSGNQLKECYHPVLVEKIVENFRK